jgi:hypothetical protein
MTTIAKNKVIKELEDIPDGLLNELMEFIHFLKFRKKNQYKENDSIDTSLASEKSLSYDWLKPEEDEVWKDL